MATMDRWQRISHIFQSALAQDARERDSWPFER
jgi:hypothetical protein